MAQDLKLWVAAEVRAELARQNVSHRQAAEWLGMSQSQITRRLNGKIAFDTVVLEILARHLGVPVRQFFPVGSAA